MRYYPSLERMKKLSKKRDFYDFYKILERLRGEDGCPWDRAQTHESLKPHLIEEAYEALEAIDSKNGAKMADELGDVLLQIVMHALIGKEEGEFDIYDVTEAASEKMVSRHPHIFGGEHAETSEDVLDLWDEIKKKERGEKSLSETLSSVSRALPSIKRAEKLQKKAAKTVSPDESLSDALAIFKKRAAELSQDSSKEDFSSLLFAAARLATLFDFDSEELLRQENEKFIKKFENIEKSTCNNERCLVEYPRVQSTLIL